MLGKMYEGEACSAARALEVVGERWTLLIVRDALFAGSTRFSDFQRRLGLAPNVLTSRLRDLVASGVFAESGDSGRHAEYHLTEKGADLATVIVALTAWGDRWQPAPQGRPVDYQHDGCGGQVQASLDCSTCGERVQPRDIRAEVAGWARRHKRNAIGARARVRDRGPVDPSPAR